MINPHEKFFSKIFLAIFFIFLGVSQPTLAEKRGTPDEGGRFSFGAHLGISIPTLGGMTERLGYGGEATIRLRRGFGLGLYIFSTNKSEETTQASPLNIQDVKLFLYGGEVNYFFTRTKIKIRLGIRAGLAKLTILLNGASNESNAAFSFGPVLSLDYLLFKYLSLNAEANTQFLPQFSGNASTDTSSNLTSFLAGVRVWF